MRLVMLVLCALAGVGLYAQSSHADAATLGTVHITTTVKAGGTVLAPGMYELRLTGESPAPPDDSGRRVQEWVEFVTGGKVVAREAAEILYDDDLPAEGASAQKARSGTRVEMLKEGEFLRISVKREHDRYLIYLPVSPPAQTQGRLVK
jgi:hypothetical protein